MFPFLIIIDKSRTEIVSVKKSIGYRYIEAISQVSFPEAYSA